MSRYFAIEEYHDRWKKVQAAMKKKGYDYALIWGKTGGTYERSGDILYLANYYSTHSGHEPDSNLWSARAFSALFMPQNGVPHLHTDEAGDPRLDIVTTDKVSWHWKVGEGVGEWLSKNKIKGRVALVGSDFLPTKYMKQLEQKAPDIEFVPEDDLVRDVRRIKSPRELECFREGGQIVTRGLNRLLEALIEGKTEAEAAAIGAAEVIRQGGNYHRIPVSHGDSLEFFERSPDQRLQPRRAEKGRHGANLDLRPDLARLLARSGAYGRLRRQSDTRAKETHRGLRRNKRDAARKHQARRQGEANRADGR